MNNKTVNKIAWALLTVLAISVFVLYPFLVIWILNTLFLVPVPYNVFTWLASACTLLMVLGVKTTSKGK